MYHQVCLIHTYVSHVCTKDKTKTEYVYVLVSIRTDTVTNYILT